MYTKCFRELYWNGTGDLKLRLELGSLSVSMFHLKYNMFKLRVTITIHLNKQLLHWHYSYDTSLRSTKYLFLVSINRENLFPFQKFIEMIKTMGYESYTKIYGDMPRPHGTKLVAIVNQLGKHLSILCVCLWGEGVGMGNG